MDQMEAMRQRHSVRAFQDEPLTAQTVDALRDAVDACNALHGLHIQLFVNEPEAFAANKPSYGSFQNCRNYLALAAPKGMDEQIGYYGEQLVLTAQALGVNSCWVALTYKKGKADVQLSAGEKLYMVIALGYGQTEGKPHRTKSLSQISDCTPNAPDWYRNGLEGVLLAPTAMNQQKFYFELCGESVKAKAGLGFYTKVDLGIAKCHFEIASGKDGSVWA